jgi:hypothetical protein
MRVFVGFGYNEQDAWIEEQVFPILRCLGFTVEHGKDMHGETLQPAVESRIERSDAAIGVFTIRPGQGDADFNSHIWVRDEMLFAYAKRKTIIPIYEEGVRVPQGLLGDRQYIPLSQNDRLACVVELLTALGRRNIRRLKLDPDRAELSRNLRLWRHRPGFVIQYRTQDEEGRESQLEEGRLELVDQGFYLNVADVSQRALVEVQGSLNGQVQFSSGWVSADAVQVIIS